MTAVSAAFEQARAERRAAVVGYLPAGFPSVPGAVDAAVAMAEAGADIVEIGLPYSDPLMDGPVIQEAVHRALTGGIRVTDVLATVEAVAGAGVPVLVMTYWNPVDHYGVPAFARDLAAAGGSGLITPDLTPEEAGPWLAAAAAARPGPGVPGRAELVPERLELITDACRGFVYAASLMGITGARESVGGQAAGLVGRVRELHRPAGRGRARACATGRRRRRWPGSPTGSSSGSAFVSAAAGRGDARRRASPASRSWPPSWPRASGPPQGRRSVTKRRHTGSDLRRKSHVNVAAGASYNLRRSGN